jgi:hypothetical protein
MFVDAVCEGIVKMCGGCGVGVVWSELGVWCVVSVWLGCVWCDDPVY